MKGRSKKGIVFAWVIIGLFIGLAVGYFIENGVVAQTALDTNYFASRGYNAPTIADYYVSVSGSDTNSGTTESSAFKTLQKAIDVAQPGDNIKLLPGRHIEPEQIYTKRSGTKDNPITIFGDSSAILTSYTSGRLFEINHNYITLYGFTIDGLRDTADSGSMGGYIDKLIYIQGKGIKSGVEGLRIIKMTIQNGGGECIRMRYFNQNCEIAYNIIKNCGVYDYVFPDGSGGKNGEGIYVGTSSNQWTDGKNPTADPDETSNNWIHHNTMITNGNECVDIKEGATNNIIEYNICSAQRDPNSACLDSRGDGNIFRYNEAFDCDGAGVRLGGNTISGYQYGKNNQVYENNIHDTKAGGIKFMASPQARICGNTFANVVGGNSVGSYASLYNPTAACNGGGEQNQTEPPEEQQLSLNEPGFKILEIATVSASSYDTRTESYSPPEDVLDSNLLTKWAAQGNGQYITLDLGASKKVSFVKIAFQSGTIRTQNFNMQLSLDGTAYQNVYSGVSSGNTLDLQKFDFTDSDARYVRIVGNGNSVNDWNSLTEVRVYSVSTATEPNEDDEEISFFDNLLILFSIYSIYIYAGLGGSVVGFFIGRSALKNRRKG